MVRKPQQRQNAPAQGSKLSGLITIVIVLAVIGLLAIVGIKIPDTMKLEAGMDTASADISYNGTTGLIKAIGDAPRAATRKNAEQMVNEMIAGSLEIACFKLDIEELEKFENALKSDPAWKPYDTEENRKLLVESRNKLIEGNREQLRELAELKGAAQKLIAREVPAPADVVYFLSLPVPAALNNDDSNLVGIGYAAAIVSKNRDLESNILELVKDPAPLYAMTDEPCVDCQATGVVKCNACLREPGKCAACKGTGTITVRGMNKKDFTTSTEQCKKCLGSGQCSNCKGTGNRPCFYCKGNKTRPNSVLAQKNMREKIQKLERDADRHSEEINQFLQHQNSN